MAADLSWASAQNLAKALAGYVGTAYPGGMNAEQWIDALMDANGNNVKALLEQAPSNLDDNEASKVLAVLTTIRGFTYTDANGVDQIFWNYVASVFASKSCYTEDGVKDAVEAAVEFAKNNPDLSPQEVANHHEVATIIQDRDMGPGY